MGIHSPKQPKKPIHLYKCLHIQIDGDFFSSLSLTYAIFLPHLFFCHLLFCSLLISRSFSVLLCYANFNQKKKLLLSRNMRTFNCIKSVLMKCAQSILSACGYGVCGIFVIFDWPRDWHHLLCSLRGAMTFRNQCVYFQSPAIKHNAHNLVGSSSIIKYTLWTHFSLCYELYLVVLKKVVKSPMMTQDHHQIWVWVFVHDD